jgi:hypothetical protein
VKKTVLKKNFSTEYITRSEGLKNPNESQTLNPDQKPENFK